MNERQVQQLLDLLALYAEAYGADSDKDMTVLDLADDLMDGGAETGAAVDRIRAGLGA